MPRPCPHMSSQAEETALEECGSEWSCSLAAFLRGQSADRVRGRTKLCRANVGSGLDGETMGMVMGTD